MQVVEQLQGRSMSARAVIDRPYKSTHISDQHHLSIGARPSECSDVAHKRVLAKGGFHPVEIDAGAANLHQPVLAADPLQQSVRPLAHEISRSE